MDENVKLMNLEEIGLYAICLNHCWLNGSLPADPLEIARAMKVPKGQFLRAWPRVIPCFQQREDARWTNPRQERERQAAQAKSEKARESANTKWHGDASVMRSHGSRIDNAMPRASDSVCESGSGYGFGEKKDGDMRAEWDDQWQDFRGKYEAAKPDLIDEDFLKAHHVWRILDFSQREDSILGIAARIDAGQWDEPRYIPKPEKYLQEDRKRKVLPRAGPKMSRGEATSLKALEIFRRSQ